MSVSTSTINELSSGLRLDKYLIKNYKGMTKGLIEKSLRSGWIKINNKKIKSDYILHFRDELKIAPYVMSLSASNIENKNPKLLAVPSDILISTINKNIIFSNKDFMILNKPSGLAVQGGSKVIESVDGALKYLGHGDDLKLVHRIDKDTSGLLIIAKHDIAARKFSQIFKNKEIQKYYIALLAGVPLKLSGIIKNKIGKIQDGFGVERMMAHQDGKIAITEYETLDYAYCKAALILFKPITGRTHQLRVHSLEIGFPILGDGKYGGSEAFMDGFDETLHLHAYKVNFNYDGKEFTFTAPIAKHIKDSMKNLGLTIN
jgi:23S rRNA pseudouridine955/2504/2580 synthase